MSGGESINIGTSGWHYVHWSGPFYPVDLTKDRFLKYYSQYFQTSEINNTFYRLPAEKTLAAWRESVPDEFTFSIKASRYITHMKKLADPEKSLPGFLKRVEILQGKLGPILFQLPPYLRLNLERLQAFLKALPGDFKFVFEFREASWFQRQVYEALAMRGAAFCIWDLAGNQSPRVVTGDTAYIRLHGPDGAYRGQYADETLSDWANAISGWVKQGTKVYCYFDNDEAGYAPQDALRLKAVLDRQ